MIPTPMERVESLRIGTVEFVAPNEIKVSLEIEAPESIALNAEVPRPFPRINSYMLIPSDDGYLVGQVEWMVVERSPYPKRRGMKDFGLVDLPYPLRKMSLNPVGTLTKIGSEKERYRFRRGTDAFPSVGDAVLLPTQEQLRSIVESGDNRRIKIGTSPLAGDADVKVDPNRLFGRHLAVLGNTGSGKSCSVAGLIRWSLEAAQKDGNKIPNARFIVLDPNGEYSRAFSGNSESIKPRLFKVDPKDGSDDARLQVPLWFWNSSEWISFAQASGKTQSPLLRRALREVRVGSTNTINESDEEKRLELRRYLSSIMITIRRDLKNGTIRNEETKFGFRLKAIKEDLETKSNNFPEYQKRIKVIDESIRDALDATFNSFVDKGKTVEYYRAFNEKQINMVVESMDKLLTQLGGIIYQEGPSEDAPLRFSGTDFADHLQVLAESEGVTQYLDFLVMRIRTMLSDSRMRETITGDKDISLEQWLTDYIGGNQPEQGNLTIIDLSLVPSEIVHIVTAVVARMVFEALQRYRKIHHDHKVLPTVLVMEEAHTFVKRYKEESENQTAAAICCQVFERIAREGRKFGLGLVLSSQRPSELSPTVLSQCNTFLIHRISNDKDQELIHRFVPDNLKGLLRDLPTLPSQNAILLGWASELPVLVRMNDLPGDRRPQSDDPDFWNVWSGACERTVNWKNIADDWQQVGSQNSKKKSRAGPDDRTLAKR